MRVLVCPPIGCARSPALGSGSILGSLGALGLGLWARPHVLRRDRAEGESGFINCMHGFVDGVRVSCACRRGVYVISRGERRCLHHVGWDRIGEGKRVVWRAMCQCVCVCVCRMYAQYTLYKYERIGVRAVRGPDAEVVVEEMGWTIDVCRGGM